MMENSSFESFLIKEYDNIAQAHFKSIQTITDFFRYYLLIMAIPISGLALIFQKVFDFKNNSSIKNFLISHNLFFFLFCISISFIGIGLFIYILNLRFDSILYARAINGIRKHFYGESLLFRPLKSHMKVLPESTRTPPYRGTWTFLSVFFIFALINTIYFVIGLGFLKINDIINLEVFHFVSISDFIDKLIRLEISIISISFLSFFIIHFLIYTIFARYRDKSYLKSNIIGVDIDGVLNKHREHFCKILLEKTNKQIAPDDIKKIPVRQNEGKGILKEDEENVFKSLEYWRDMPQNEGMQDFLKQISNKWKIYFFTERNWKIKKDDYNKYYKDHKIIKKVRFCLCNKIKILTFEWLGTYAKKAKVIFTKGNKINRVSIAMNKRIRYFIEDDVMNAIQLSSICDYVFLISHPYNSRQSTLSILENSIRSNYPKNVIKVRRLDEIVQYLNCMI